MVMLFQPPPPNPEAGAALIAGPRFFIRAGITAADIRAIPRASGRRSLRIVRRLIRYVGLAALSTIGGYLGGYYLTVLGAAKASTVLSLAIGVKTTLLAAEDLRRIGIESQLLRGVLAAKIGVAFGALGWLGAGSGVVQWHVDQYLTPFQRYTRNRVKRAGRRGLIGWPF